ncbi:bestrophin-4 [Copidosoma floridanum]|uniref:bestrophin-4 n=1 Tax=Copidosoma floridanum TaxID=29053 RepID=UPI0006C99C73|nr:bestrophin-4 [Copidosoma floridanum]XP_014209411.1 bestrophin-4 [Copidosoma floridanum]
MTISYTAEVATCRGFGCFLKLLLRWKASVYKLIWTDMLLFLTIYYCLSGLYRLGLEEEQKRVFERVVEFCRKHTSSSPLSFVLGFYVTIVMNRWWSQYITIPWPDSIAVFVSATIHGNDERGRLMRRTIVRYVCVCLTLVLASVSPRVKKRFPTMDHYVDAGLLLENELAIFQSLNNKFPKPSKHWLPIVWASSIVTRARKEGRIRDDFAVKTLIDELNKFRGSCGGLVHYDTISIPLVYTQVVTIAVYTYFLTNVIGQQWIHEEPQTVDIYFPVFTTLEMFFYMGWLKVAETLINPFGEDDDDFEVNWIVDRNLQVSYLIVDEMHHEHPELIRDQYWDEVFPTELPYTAAAEQFREEHPEPSTAGIQLSAAQQELQPSSVRIDELEKEYQRKYQGDLGNEDAISGIHFVAGGKISRSGSRVSHRDRTMSAGSTPSNIGGSLTRINSVTNVLKRIFNKEDRPDGTRLPNSTSAASLRVPGGGGSMRIGVIEEVDEQMTMTSMRPPDNRPHVQSIFPQGPPPPSEPVDVPGSGSMSRNGNLLLSTSAPVSYPDSAESASTARYRPTRGQMSAPGGHTGAVFDSAAFVRDSTRSSTASSASDNSLDDEFTRLKSEREKQRKEKVLQKLTRSVSNRASGEQSSMNTRDTEILLSDLPSMSRLNVEALENDDKPLNERR